MGQVRVAVATATGDELGRQQHLAGAVEGHRKAVVVDRHHRAGRAVVQAGVAGLGVQQHPVALGVGAVGAGAPGRAGQRRTPEVPAGHQAGTDAVGQVLAVGVGHSQHGHGHGAVGNDVGHHRLGHGLSGGERRGLLVLPPVLGPDGLAGRRPPGPQLGQGLAVGALALAAVGAQRRGHDGALRPQLRHLRSQSPRPHSGSLAGIAQAPQRRSVGGRYRLQHRRRVPGRDLAHLVEHHDGARGEGPLGEVDAQAGDGGRLQAHRAQASHGLIGGGHAEHGPPGPGAGRCGGVHGGGLAEPGRGDHRAQVGAGAAKGPHGLDLVGAQAALGGDGGLHQLPVDSGRGAGGQGAQVLEHGVLQGPMRHGGPLGRAAALSGRETHDMLGGHELARHGRDLGRGPPPAGEGSHVRVHVRLGEAGSGGTQAGLGIEEGGGDLVGVDGPGAGAAHQCRLQGDVAIDAELSGLVPPALDQQGRREAVVLGRAGGEGGGVVGPHARGGRLVDRSAGLQLGLDGEGPLGERPQHVAIRTRHLPGAVAVRPPRHPQFLRQQALQLGLVDGAGGLGPVEQRVGVEGHVRTVGPAHQVGDQAMGVQLRVALAGGAVEEPGHREPGRRHPPAHPLGLLAGDRRVVLQERQSD